ncbi:MAG: hypothetical protein J5I50_00425 [Chitinophagaceae bacterium]|nr:hypothetical protein [Chitinophagaceae bacterium]
MIGVFRSNNPLNASILFVYGLLLKLYWFIHLPPLTDRPSDGFLYTALIDLVRPALQEWRFIEAVVVYLFLFVQAMSLNYLMSSRKMTADNSFLPAMAYLLITSLLPEWNILSPTLLINSFLIWILFKISTLATATRVRSTLFNIGLGVGLCSFLYFPSILLLILVIVGVAIVRPVKVFEMGMIFLGLLTTWYFLAAALYLTDQMKFFSTMEFGFDLPDIWPGKAELGGLALVLLLLLIGFYYVQAYSSKQIVRVRKGWSFILFILLFLGCIPLFQDNSDLRDWIMTIVPGSLLTSAAFYYLPVRFIRSILHWGVVGFIIFFQYFS